MFRTRLAIQDPGQGLIGTMLDGIAWAGSDQGFVSLSAAVAYATWQGATLLIERLQLEDRELQKRWLVSLDFGHTEPQALERLAALPDSQVRVPNGRIVLGRGAFSPITAFHPKLYLFAGLRRPLRNSNLGLFVGSANLSLSGLVTGGEAGKADRWIAPLTAGEVRDLRGTGRQVAWFERAWQSADPLGAVIDEYRRLRVFRPRRVWVPPEEKSEANRLFSPPGGAEVAGDLGVLLRSARALWIETHELNHNLGPGRPGNQLDMTPGTRVFFGLSADRVARNTRLGPVTTQCPGFPAVTKNLRFGNNAMDKLNLPVPGTESPAAGYDNSRLLFERIPAGAGERDLFQLRLLTPAQLVALRRRTVAERRIVMVGGREYGLLF
jgi:hypothetical protein